MLPLCGECGKCGGREGVVIAGAESLSEQGAREFGPNASLGLAVDVGTTTLVMRLYDLNSGDLLGSLGEVNPQREYGADVISRITAWNAGQGPAMRDALIRCLAEMRHRLVPDAEIQRAVVVGNTVMMSILAGVSPASIGVAPHVPQDYFGHSIELSELAQEVFVPRCVGGFVGADITADVVALGPQATPTLLLDLGTNGEVVLFAEGRALACATAAGPVFEGAGITCGMPALPGAIASVEWNGFSYDVQTIGNDAPKGFCGTGVLSAIAELLRAGAIDETGYMPAGTQDMGGVQFTQQDVRAVQLAKAAIRAGIQRLLDEEGLCAEDIRRVDIAGGFGLGLNPDVAVRIGLLPREFAEKVAMVGNTAIEGAGKILVEGGHVPHLEYVELSADEQFSEAYLRAMNF